MKRKTPTMKRTPSVPLLVSGSIYGGSSPLPEHPKEKLKTVNHTTPPAACGATPWTVIGFHPKVSIDEEGDIPPPASPHRASERSSSKSPGGSPRSALGDVLSRPWERKDEGVGLGIVVALSGIQEEICKEREDGRGFPVPSEAANGFGPVRTQAHPHSGFATSRASPPIPIHAPSHTNSGRHSPSQCTDRNCCPVLSFGLAPISVKQDLIYNNSYQGGGSVRPSNNWLRPNVENGRQAANWGHQVDMDVDRNEIYTTSTPLPRADISRQNLLASASLSQNFLDACHLCRRCLGEGRDIYIYRGDRAFCSPECRHQQILIDERPEKCAAAVMKGASDARSSTQRSRVMAAGTATAAAA